MADHFTPAYGAETRWRWAFIALSAIIFILLPSLSPAYGQTGDEWLQLYYGRDIWEYFFNGNQQALDYNTLLDPTRGGATQFKGQELYGGLFDFGTEILHRWFPSVQHLVLRHICNAITNVLLIISTGLITRRLSGRWSVGVLALVLMLLSPRIFGEGMNNPKDIPFAAGFTLSVYAVLAFLQDGLRNRWRHAVLLALGFGLAFGVRAGGGLLFLAYLIVIIALWYFLNKESRNGWWRESADERTIVSGKGGKGEAEKRPFLAKKRNRVFLFIAGSLVAGYIIGLLAWPWGLDSPISHPMESLQGMTNRETKIRTLFEGRYQWNYAMPWYYELKWILISNPISVILGTVLFVVLGFLNRKRLGIYTLMLALFAAFFPLLYMMYKHSSVYDTWRHVFFVYPFWVVMAALGWAYLGDFIAQKMAKGGVTKERYIGHGLAFVLTLPALFFMLRNHPNEYVYFNELVGGIRGANGQYETDYYYNSSQQQIDWLRKSAPLAQGRKTEVRANMGGFGPNCFRGDTARFSMDYLSYYRKGTKPWDYYLLFPRLIPEGQVKNKTWLPKNAAHVVSVDGVPISAFIRRTDTSDMAAANAMAAKDYATAATLYAQYLRGAPNDALALVSYAQALAASNRMSEAIAAAKSATEADPEDVQAWGLLARFYHAAGNDGAAQDAQNRALAIQSEMEEGSGE